MSKPRGDPSCGISSEEVLIPTERHPACRQREARSGSGTERENLAGDNKGKGASGSNREAESTDAPERGGLARERQHRSQRAWTVLNSSAGLEQRLRRFLRTRRCDESLRDHENTVGASADFRPVG